MNPVQRLGQVVQGLGMIRVGLNRRFPVLNGGRVVARMRQILTEQVLRIRIVGLQRDHSLQEFRRPFRLVFLFCRESQEIESTRIVRLQTIGGFELPACVVILACFEVEAAPDCNERWPAWIEPGGLGKLLESARTVELIYQCNAQVEVGLGGAGLERHCLLESF